MTEKLILILLLPITFPIMVFFWLLARIVGIFVAIFYWTYSGYEFDEGDDND